MFDADKCPLCGKHCPLIPSPTHDAGEFGCDYVPRLMISYDLLNDVGTYAEKRRNAIFSDLLTRRFSDQKKILYIYDETEGLYCKTDGKYIAVNVCELMKKYPNWTLDRYDQCLINIYNYGLDDGVTIYGGLQTGIDTTNLRLLLCTDFSPSSDIDLILEQILRTGYVEKCEIMTNQVIFLSGAGLSRVRELTEKNEHRKECFIAISFDKDVLDISNTIEESVKQTGFIPVRIDQIEHNNQIVPEIISHIQKCRFLIMDVTKPNNGAYYEAGIARGLDKDIIICCRQTELNDESKDKRPHFDIAQQSMVVWNDLDELKKKLSYRIQETII